MFPDRKAIGTIMAVSGAGIAPRRVNEARMDRP